MGSLPPASVQGPAAGQWSQLAPFLKAGLPGTNGNDFAKHSFLAIILPYIEQGNVLKANGTGYDFKKDWFDPQNRVAAATRIPTFECPSVPITHEINPILEPGIYGAGWVPKTADYMAVTRSNAVQAVWAQLGLTMPASTTDNAYRAILTSNQGTQLVEILDGMSNTLMIAEQGARPQGWAFGAKYATQPTFMNGAWAHSGNDVTCSGTQPAPAGTQPPGKITAAGQAATACTINCWNQGEIYSFHSQAANVCFGDGSVRTLKSNLSFRTLLLLAARNDGQPVNFDQ